MMNYERVFFFATRKNNGSLTDPVVNILGKTKKIIYPSELFFFLYVSLNFPYVAQLCASNLAKHIKKITALFGVDYFLRVPLRSNNTSYPSRKKDKRTDEKEQFRRVDYFFLFPYHYIFQRTKIVTFVLFH